MPREWTPEDIELMRVATIATIINAMEINLLDKDENRIIRACNEWGTAFNRQRDMTVATTINVMCNFAEALATGWDVTLEEFLRRFRAQAGEL